MQGVPGHLPLLPTLFWSIFFPSTEFEVPSEHSRCMDLGHSNLKSKPFLATHSASLGGHFFICKMGDIYSISEERLLPPPSIDF